jgi:hypothetical protein
MLFYWSNIIELTHNGSVSWTKTSEPVMLLSMEEMGAKLGEGMLAMEQHALKM